MMDLKTIKQWRDEELVKKSYIRRGYLIMCAIEELERMEIRLTDLEGKVRRLRIALDVAEIADLSDDPSADGEELFSKFENIGLGDIWTDGRDLHEVASEFRRAALVKDVEGGIKAARGALPWNPGDELPEDTIRRLRGEGRNVCQ